LKVRRRQKTIGLFLAIEKRFEGSERKRGGELSVRSDLASSQPRQV